MSHVRGRELIREDKDNDAEESDVLESSDQEETDIDKDLHEIVRARD